jgi:hypothetical protein
MDAVTIDNLPIEDHITLKDFKQKKRENKQLVRVKVNGAANSDASESEEIRQMEKIKQEWNEDGDLEL